MLELDERIVFFENKSNVNFLNRRKNFLNEREKFLLNEEVYTPFKGSNQEQNGTVFVGFNSDFAKNNILNSDFYKNDKEVKTNIYSAFNDSDDYLGNEISSLCNPYKLINSYGQKNADPFFDNIENEPFDDVDNIENVNEFFLMPHEIKYPRYFNAYSILRLNSNICVFGFIDTLDGTLTTESSLRGIKAELIKNSIDARGREVTITNSITLRDIEIDENGKQIFSIESFSDEEYEDLVTGDDELLQRSFNYTTRVVNGQVYTIFDTSENATSTIPQFTNKIIFYTEDNVSIPPFDDSRTVVFYAEGDDMSNAPFDENRATTESQNTDQSEEEIFTGSGFDTDNSNGGSPDSFAFSGHGD